MSRANTAVSTGALTLFVIIAGLCGLGGCSDASPVTYRGFADLEFGLEGNFWYLVRWVDLRGAPAPWHGSVICPTLGEARAVYRDR